MNATLLTLPELRLITALSESFPDGNRAAFEAIESRLDTLHGRKFYALVYASKDGMEYHAGLVPADETEEKQFEELGFTIKRVPKGSWARVKLMDWQSKTNEIGPTIGKMIGTYGIDPSRPQMEFYRSSTELHLFVPLPESSKD